MANEDWRYGVHDLPMTASNPQVRDKSRQKIETAPCRSFNHGASAA